jgi:hypothetical protein
MSARKRSKKKKAAPSRPLPDPPPLPPDDPMLREELDPHRIEQEDDAPDVDELTMARARLEALRQTRGLAAEDDT